MSVVSFGDAVLYEADVRLLEPGQWLNDAVISFCFEHLRHSLQQQQEEQEQRQGVAADAADAVRGSVVFVDPAAVQLIHSVSAAEAKALVLEPLGACDPATSLVLLAFSDVDVACHPNAGSPWALLVFDTALREAWYLDSMPFPSMRQVAQRLFQTISPSLQASRAQPEHPYTFRECAIPAQGNSSDCGMHAVATAEHVARERTLQGIAFHHLTPHYILQQRRRWQVSSRKVESRVREGG